MSETSSSYYLSIQLGNSPCILMALLNNSTSSKYSLSPQMSRWKSNVETYAFQVIPGSRGGEKGVRKPTPLENRQATGFLSNTGPDPLKNHKTTKPAFTFTPSSACQRNFFKWYIFQLIQAMPQFELPRPIPRNSVESDNGCTSMIYFNNAGDNVTLTLYNVTFQSGRVVKAYEYYQTCIATKTFEFFGFLSEARNDTPNLTACCMSVPNLILLKIGHLCSSFVKVFP